MKEIKINKQTILCAWIWFGFCHVDCLYLWPKEAVGGCVLAILTVRSFHCSWKEREPPCREGLARVPAPAPTSSPDLLPNVTRLQFLSWGPLLAHPMFSWFLMPRGSSHPFFRVAPIIWNQLLMKLQLALSRPTFKSRGPRTCPQMFLD